MSDLNYEVSGIERHQYELKQQIHDLLEEPHISELEPFPTICTGDPEMWRKIRREDDEQDQEIR